VPRFTFLRRVRKCNGGIITSAVSHLLTGGGGGGGGGGTDEEVEQERARVRQAERVAGCIDHRPALWYECPPTAVAGDVVVCASPVDPGERIVKRVTGVGGQWLRGSGSERQWQRLQALPPYTLYLEGSNRESSQDSRELGPLSKNLLIGVAEWVVWPRFRRLKREAVTDERGRPIAVWP
jgi:hypothetical protein